MRSIPTSFSTKKSSCHCAYKCLNVDCHRAVRSLQTGKLCKRKNSVLYKCKFSTKQMLIAANVNMNSMTINIKQRFGQCSTWQPHSQYFCNYPSQLFQHADLVKKITQTTLQPPCVTAARRLHICDAASANAVVP